MAIPLGVAEESGLIETRAQRRSNPKGKKARKAAARLTAQRDAQSVLSAAAELPAQVPAPRKAKKGKPQGKGKGRGSAGTKARRSRAARPEQLPAIPVRPIAVRQVVAAPSPALSAPALILPERAEPLVVADAPRVLSRVDMPELTAAAPQPAAPEPEPAVLLLPPPVVPEPDPATALAALADAPLPPARALVPARKQGLVAVIAFLLRDSGRRLARWSARRQQTREEQAALRRAEAHQLNLQRELDALAALRRNKG